MGLIRWKYLMCIQIAIFVCIDFRRLRYVGELLNDPFSEIRYVQQVKLSPVLIPSGMVLNQIQFRNSPFLRDTLFTLHLWKVNSCK